MLSRVRTRVRSRPRIPRHDRDLISELYPGVVAAIDHVCDQANSGEMRRRLPDIGEGVPEGRHALVSVGGAGWHRSKALVRPGNASPMWPPPYSPEPNPSRTVFAVLRHHRLANRLFDSVGHVRRVAGKSGTTS